MTYLYSNRNQSRVTGCTWQGPHGHICWYSRTRAFCTYVFTKTDIYSGKQSLNAWPLATCDIYTHICMHMYYTDLCVYSLIAATVVGSLSIVVTVTHDGRRYTTDLLFDRLSDSLHISKEDISLQLHNMHTSVCCCCCQFSCLTGTVQPGDILTIWQQIYSERLW